MSDLSTRNRRVGLWVLAVMFAVGGIAAALAALTTGIRRAHDKVMPKVETSMTAAVIIAIAVTVGLWVVYRFVLPKLDRMSTTDEPPLT